MSQERKINQDPMRLSKLAVLDLIGKSLQDSGVSNSVQKLLIGRIGKGLEVRSGDCISQEFAYELIYSLRHLLQYGTENFGARPGRKFEPVDIETFVCSSDYMGQKEFIRPAILSELKRLFEDRYRYHEVILGGGIGTGKNYFTDLSLAYIIYDLSSYYSPQLEFGLAPGSSIIFMMQSASIELAKAVMFNQFKARIALSSYFTKQFPFDTKVKTKLNFPNDIVVMPLSSMDTAALGLNIYGGAQDELSFRPVVKSSKKIGRKEGIYDQAAASYNQVIRRIESRFLILGKIPGKLFLIGSASQPGNFIDKKIQEVNAKKAAGKEVTSFVMSMSQWESLPSARYSKETFRIELPNENTTGKILEKGEEPSLGAEVIEAPVDFRVRFEEDFEGSLRDIAGIAVGSVSKFIRNVEKITLAAEKHAEIFEGKQLFVADEIDQRAFETNESMVNMEYISKHLDPHTKMGGHIDLALTGDSVGLCIGRIFDFKKSKSEDPQNTEGEILPIFCIDGAVSVVPPPNREINLFSIRDLILFLKEHLNIVFVTFDSYESAMMMQSFRNHRISSTVQSVDRTPQPYLDFKTAILTERMLYPNHPILLKEIRNLLRDPETGKIDHPIGGTKDIADCAAGVVYRFTHARTSYRPSDRQSGRPKTQGHRPQGQNRLGATKLEVRRIRTDKGRII